VSTETPLFANVAPATAKFSEFSSIEQVMKYRSRVFLRSEGLVEEGSRREEREG
jgi:hypothetical protein